MADETPAPVQTTLNGKWRPWSGWIVCVGGTGYALMLHPLLSWVSQVLAVVLQRPVPPPAQLDTTLLFELFLVLLGYRTFEKVKDVAAK